MRGKIISTSRSLGVFDCRNIPRCFALPFRPHPGLSAECDQSTRSRNVGEDEQGRPSERAVRPRGGARGTQTDHYVQRHADHAQEPGGQDPDRYDSDPYERDVDHGSDDGGSAEQTQWGNAELPGCRKQGRPTLTYGGRQQARYLRASDEKLATLPTKFLVSRGPCMGRRRGVKNRTAGKPRLDPVCLELDRVFEVLGARESFPRVSQEQPAAEQHPVAGEVATSA